MLIANRIISTTNKLYYISKFAKTSDVRGKARLNLFELRWCITMLSGHRHNIDTIEIVLEEMNSFIKESRSEL